MPINLVTEIIDVSPELARQYLEKNTGNRRIRPRHVDMLKREIAEDRWTPNGQGIVFADTGRLLDGQHRLEAIASGDKTVPLMVTHGAKESAYGTLDQGIKRTAADDLRSMGIANATKAASAARLILLWTKGLTPKSSVLAKSEITDFLIAHPEIADIIATVHPARKSVPTSGLAAVYFMASQSKDPSLRHRLDTFLKGLETGANLNAGSPILTLRNTGQTLRKGASMSVDGWFGLTMQAWNAFSAGENRQVFKNTNWPERVAGFDKKRIPV
ncbi:hypothetical protein BAJUN_00720 [Bajunvirus bajun]|uniref:Uncharacterized protein n=1 Tax=Brevundimonas phage vB_BgoS-Bajun TaxID=2948594 RepID=A0A9E7N6X7_9CAUD|nr:hypothetical protein BAJUN_00720 [Brevundimonas phage vB_BgoS-Bajun]